MTRKTTSPRPWPLRLGAILAGLWYFLVYTHLAALALAHCSPAKGAHACCCAATGTAHADSCALPDESMGCHGPRNSAGSACLLAATCADELPAAPQTDALTWPHLAATAYALQPRLQTGGQHFARTAPSFSLLSAPPDKVPKAPVCSPA